MKRLFIVLALPAMLLACKKDNVNENVYKGSDATVYHGKAWSWVKLAENGAPQQLSLTIDDAALNTVTHGNEGPHSHENNIIVPLHDKAKQATPFEFIMLNWNPAGHEPSGIYDLPHFDIHFYTTSLSDVMAYTDQAKLNTDPAPAYLPANHVGGAPVPTMGKHWIDVTSPELGGQVPFTQTFIYGSYNGDIVFYEPMITLDFLKNTAAFERTLPVPQKFKVSGYYPTKMLVIRKSGTVNIILDGFVYRQAS
ncbi:MAG TPA: hypothetical protein VFZ78_00160 [Flavisolibacter sp.]